MTKPKFTYDVKIVSREALEDLADFNISYYITGHCGPKLQRIFDEARIPVPPTAAELEKELVDGLMSRHFINGRCTVAQCDLERIFKARKREAGQ